MQKPWNLEKTIRKLLDVPSPSGLENVCSSNNNNDWSGQVGVADTVGCGDSFAAALDVADMVGSAVAFSHHYGMVVRGFGWSGQVDVADTVGCGDSFAAAVVLGYTRGHRIPPLLALANAVGAATAMGSGAGHSPPPTNDLFTCGRSVECTFSGRPGLLRCVTLIVQNQHPASPPNLDREAYGHALDYPADRIVPCGEMG